MLIKSADDHSTLIARLEQQATGAGKAAQQASDELRKRKAGIKGERDSAYLIDFDFGKSPNWAVIHDLRLALNGRTAQIDHLLINRWLDVYVLETKQFHGGIKITEIGEFLRWNSFKRTFEGMASPLEQNERHIMVLRDAMNAITLPTRLGFDIPPAFHQYVLVASDARIDRPKKFDASRVIKADQLRSTIWREVENENGLFGLIRTAAKLVSSETIEYVARQLVARHEPAKEALPAAGLATPPEQLAVRPSAGQPKPRIEPVLASNPRRPATAALPPCKTCGATHGDVHYGKFGYYLKCAACQANTAIRFTCLPGHKPRLRKEGRDFYRDCAECSSSELVHHNSGGP